MCIESLPTIRSERLSSFIYRISNQVITYLSERKFRQNSRWSSRQNKKTSSSESPRWNISTRWRSIRERKKTRSEKSRFAVAKPCCCCRYCCWCCSRWRCLESRFSGAVQDLRGMEMWRLAETRMFVCLSVILQFASVLPSRRSLGSVTRNNDSSRSVRRRSQLV